MRRTKQATEISPMHAATRHVAEAIQLILITKATCSLFTSSFWCLPPPFAAYIVVMIVKAKVRVYAALYVSSSFGRKRLKRVESYPR